MSKLSKILIYGGNFIFPSLTNILRNNTSISLNPNLANPYGAIFYGGLDLLGTLSDKIKESTFTRLAKVAGFGYYGVSTSLDLFSIAGGNYNGFAELPFDMSMAYQLGKDVFSAYGRKSFSKDFSSLKNKAQNLIGKISKKKQNKK